MRVGKYEVRLGYERRGRILALRSEVAVPLLNQALSGLCFSELRIDKRVFVFRPRYVFWFLRHWIFTSRSVANLCAHIRSHRFQVVVAMDFLNAPVKTGNQSQYLLDECALQLQKVCFFTVQHGWQWQTKPRSRPIRNLTLLTFGSHSANQFPDYGRRECQLVPVGSLALSNYLSTRPAKTEQLYDFCLVSSIRNEKFVMCPDERAEAFIAMVELFERYSQLTASRVLVALNNRGEGISSQLEKAWFVQRLGSGIDFTDPRHKFGGLIEVPTLTPGLLSETSSYGSYLASDVSKVTIGGTSTVLWESFARGNKILAVNMTNHSNYDFPENGVWSLRNPSQSEFENRLNEILCMDVEKWNSLTVVARERLIMSDSHMTTAARLASTVARAALAL